MIMMAPDDLSGSFGNSLGRVSVSSIDATIKSFGAGFASARVVDAFNHIAGDAPGSQVG
jgi:hypothetical protein